MVVFLLFFVISMLITCHIILYYMYEDACNGCDVRHPLYKDVSPFANENQGNILLATNIIY